MTEEIERERQEESLRVLRELREKLLSGNVSRARTAAHNLAWLQEDGLTVLKEVLFGNYPRTAKQAAAYGVRKVKGRMTKMATEVLEEGKEHADRTTREVSAKSLALMRGEAPPQPAGRKPDRGRRRIGEAPGRGPRGRAPRPNRPSGNRPSGHRPSGNR